MKRLISLIVALAACSGSTEPAPRLTVGTYAYTAIVGGHSYSGTFSATYVSADSLAGTFQVAGLRSNTTLGFRSGDEYVLYAYTLNGAIISHLIRPDLHCSARLLGQVLETCTLVKR